MNIMGITVWSGPDVSVDRENETARTLIEPVRDSAIPEVNTEYNAVVLDTTPELTGLSRTTATADNTPSRQNPPPGYESDWTSIIDNQVASSGTAAARESSGVRGHGSMAYDASIEPVLREGARLGGDYFMSNAMPVQDGSTNQMGSTVQDNLWASSAQAFAAKQARAAYNSTLYSQMVGG
jgi:hypothetical protein